MKRHKEDLSTNMVLSDNLVAMALTKDFCYVCR